MQFDPDKRYLLARPRGGFNDAMVQLEKCRRYAEAYNRVMILDMTNTGLRDGFEKVFEPSENFGCELVPWSDDMIDAFDAEKSIMPEQLQGRVSSYRGKWVTKIRRQVDRETKCVLSFDFLKDHDAQVLVHDQHGGGVLSLHALSRLTLRPEIATSIVESLLKLETPYVAVHIRHSDYKTRFSKFLKLLRPLLRNKNVLICSDSRKAKDKAAAILHLSTTVQSVSDIPDLKGRPLHYKNKFDRDQANLDLLTDLIAIALSERLHFTKLTKKFKYRVSFSGFSLVAELLRSNRDVVWHLLSSADTEELRKKFAGDPVNSTFMQRIYFTYYFFKNFEAERTIRELGKISME